MAGGALAGAFLGLLGFGLSPFLNVYREFFSLVVGLLAVLYALHELYLVSLPHPQRQRQVPSHWRYWYHSYITAGLFGLLLGAGFITFIPTATYYIVGFAVVFYGSPVTSAIIFGIYGVMRASLLWLFGRRITAPEDVEILTHYMDLTKPIMRQVNGFALASANLWSL